MFTYIKYFVLFAATMSAFSAGMVLGWTSPILDYLTEGKYNNIPIDKNQMGWIGKFHVFAPYMS